METYSGNIDENLSCGCGHHYMLLLAFGRHGNSCNILLLFVDLFIGIMGIQMKLVVMWRRGHCQEEIVIMK